MTEKNQAESKKKTSRPARSKRKLPRSGLAEEILGQGEHSAAETDPPDSATTEQPVAAEPPAPASPPADPPPSDRTDTESQLIEAPTGPERIFTFADSLEGEAYGAREEKAKVELETWVGFELAGEVFALPVSHVQEILRVNTITHVPHAPHPVRGVTNKRGRVLPVVDLRLRLGLPEAEVGRSSRILVVESRARLLGLLVDAVQQVVRIERAAVQEPPADVMTAQSDYLLGVYPLDDVLVILLDVDRVLVITDSTAALVGGKRP